MAQASDDHQRCEDEYARADHYSPQTSRQKSGKLTCCSIYSSCVKRLFIPIFLLVVARIAHAAPTPEEVLKSKGLTKVGAFYLLDGDIKFQEKLRLMRAAKFKVDDTASKRMKLERDMDN